MASSTRHLAQDQSRRGFQGGRPAASMDPVQDLTDYFRTYSRANPGVVACWCFAIGFILGWRLKPW